MKKLNGITIRQKIIGSCLALFLVIVSILTLLTQNIVGEKIEEQISQQGLYLAQEMVSELNKIVIAEESIQDLLGTDMKTIAYLIGTDKENYSNEKLVKLEKKLNIAEMNIINDKRTIVYSNMPGNVGWVYEKGSTMDSLFDGKQKDLVTEVSKSDSDGKYYKYCNVDLENGYFIQMGVSAEVVAKIKEKMNIQTLVDEVGSKENIEYSAVYDNQGTAIASSDHDDIGQTFDDDATKTAAVNGIIYNKKELYNEKWINDVQIPIYKEGKHIGSMDVALSLDALVATKKELWINTLFYTVISILIFIGLLILTIKISLKPLSQLTKYTKLMAKGDFTSSIPNELTKTKDEIGEISRATSMMQSDLKGLLGNIKLSVEDMENSSEELNTITQNSTQTTSEIAESIGMLANAATEQTNYGENIVNKINDLGDQIEIINNLVVEVFNITNETNKLSEQGKIIMGDLNSINAESTEQAIKTGRIIKDVSEYSNNAESIIELINNISDQTNLLALNASIEAARQGK